jgi:hypothetical protein
LSDNVTVQHFKLYILLLTLLYFTPSCTWCHIVLGAEYKLWCILCFLICCRVNVGRIGETLCMLAMEQCSSLVNKTIRCF